MNSLVPRCARPEVELRMIHAYIGFRLIAAVQLKVANDRLQLKATCRDAFWGLKAF